MFFSSLKIYLGHREKAERQIKYPKTTKGEYSVLETRKIPMVKGGGAGLAIVALKCRCVCDSNT